MIYKERNMESLLKKTSIGFSILIVLFLLLLPGNSPINKLNHQEYVIFYGGGDFMADFFNVQRYIAEWDPYYNDINGQSEHVYLPLAYLILMPFNSLCDYAHMSLQDCWNSNYAVFSAIVFLLLSLFFLFDALSRLNHENAWKGYNTFLLLFSSVFLFTIERGNLIILTAACIGYFLAFYDSESVWKRRLGLLCLCLAAVIKIYPVLFGLLLLADKRYKDIAFCIVCGLILTFVPFLFFKHGLANLPRLIENVRINSEVYGPSMTRYKLGMPVLGYLFAHGIMDRSECVVNVIVKCAKWLTLLMVGASFVLAYFEKRRWLQVALLTMPIILWPTNSAFYSGIYLLPFFIFFMNKVDCNRSDYVIAILLCLIMNPIQVVIGSVNISTILANFCCVVLWIVFIMISGSTIGKNYKKVKYVKQ